VAQTYERFTVGATRHGAGPTTVAFWQGGLRFIFLANKSLSDSALGVLRTTLVNQGVMV
jgi:hypothetical protein